MALLLKFTSTGKRSTLFWGFFWFGLALWDKALFLWLFSGLVVATIAVFPRELWSRCTRKNLGLAAAGLLLGALPLVAYNVASNFDTFRSNSSFSAVPISIPAARAANHLGWRDSVGLYGPAPWAPGTPREPGRRWNTFPRQCTRWSGRPLSLSQ